MSVRCSLLVLALLAVVPAASGLGIHIDAHEEECFFDVIKVGTKVGVSFQVAEGGFLDIDVTVSARLPRPELSPATHISRPTSQSSLRCNTRVL